MLDNKGNVLTFPEDEKKMFFFEFHNSGYKMMQVNKTHYRKIVDDDVLKNKY